jgi:hypothetical protein
MPKKQEIKNSEARILIYLQAVHPTRRYVTAIANKLDVDYSYLMRVLQAMTAKGWLTKHQHRTMMFYTNTPAAPLEGARLRLMSDSTDSSLQESLKGLYETEEVRLTSHSGGDRSPTPPTDEDNPPESDTNDGGDENV